MPSARSKVEIGPEGVRSYDLSMDVIFLGYYPHLIRKVVEKMDIRRGQSILSLGSGTGRNECLMAEKLGPEGRVLGLDINGEMLALSRRRCRPYPNVSFTEKRIEAPMTYQEEFDKVFISFVLHGFEDHQKVRIISNAYRALKPGGIFYVFDYHEFDIRRLWAPLRWAFARSECQLALEFLSLDLKQMLSSQGFTPLHEELFLKGHLRLLRAAR